MFNTNVTVVNKTVAPQKKPDVTKIEINKREQGSIFVNCEKGDNVWNGLFYKTPFLNRSDSSRGSFWPVSFTEHNPHIIDSYNDPPYLSHEERQRGRQRHDANIEKVLRIQAVDVIQIRFISDTEVIAEVKYLNPKEV